MANQENLTATFMEVYDGCDSADTFEKKASLAELVEQTKQHEDRWLVLIGHDSLHCNRNNYTLIKVVNKWTTGLFDLSRLSKIGFREPYLALLDTSSGAMIEVDNSNTSTLTLVKNSNEIKIQK
ncbi:MAG: hypothetical protein GY951_01220 [Psychromonas sp.]|nr:hypothetical protein [Alteromonadales bacterium]MCP5076669.1 hypothetical protein [Psychromonas sp.]